MSATRLLVLGVVRMHGQAHGYQVRRDLLSWAADRWANVRPGSIYHALKQMTKDGLVAEVAVEEGEAGPDRTLYRLTEDGETEFAVLLSRSLIEPERGAESLNAAMTFLPTLPRQRAIDLLERRMTVLAAQVTNARQGVADNSRMGKPEHVRELFRLWEYATDASVRWLRQLIDQLVAGEFVMADDSPEHFGHPAAI
ncbi:MAG TPA: PadR family transcriptional regulator [Pseudonocardiaceae bacterium]